MKKLLTITGGIFFAAFLVATVTAGPNGDYVDQTKDENLSNLQNTTLSKHNKAMLEQAEQAKIRRETIMSSITDTTSKK